MKNKIISMLLIFCLILILPVVVYGYQDINECISNNIIYKLTSDGNAEVVNVLDNAVSDDITILDTVYYNEEDYKITQISEDAFNQITKKHNIYMRANNPLDINGKNLNFSNIESIFIGIGTATEYFDAGWPEAKFKNYKITKQPQDITVTAGEIDEALEIVAEVPILLVGEGINYTWYYCKEDGTILEPAYLNMDYSPDVARYKLPEDLSYDNENNKAKDYYFICVVGEGRESAILEKSRVVKVTVNPGVYKIRFEASEFANWTSTTESFIEVEVNSDRKLDKEDIPSLDLLKPTNEGFSFKYWEIDGEKVEDVSNITFEKNTTLFPVWDVKLSFDANGGKYSDGSSVNYINTTSNSFIINEEILEPTREGYKFLGFFTKKDGGYPLIFEELRGKETFLDYTIYNQTTFYAKWKKLPSDEIDNNTNNTISNTNNNTITNNEIANNSTNNINNNSISSTTNNPKTGDNMVFFVGLLVISSVGIFITIRFRNDNKK